METQIIRYTSIVLDENTSCTLHELCELCGQNKELILELIFLHKGQENHF